MKKHNTILVIDDEPTVTDGPRLYLGESGYKVETAATGGEGIRLFETGRFDLVITDLQLPDTQGFDVLRKLKAADPDVDRLLETLRQRGVPTQQAVVEHVTAQDDVLILTG